MRYKDPCDAYVHGVDLLAEADKIWAAALRNGERERVADDPAIVSEAILPLPFVSAATWDGRELPTVKWLAHRRIPLGAPTLLSGDGATGKTTIALQLCVATVTQTDWLGAVIDHCGPALFFSAEEPESEVHRRLAPILESRGLTLRDTLDLHVYCCPGEDAALAQTASNGVVVETNLFRRLHAAALAIRPTLIVLEAVADIAAINELVRSEVRQFVQKIPRALAMSTGAAVVMIGHPSVAGMAEGSGRSGSTHWRNGVRSQLYFVGTKDDADNDLRELRVVKSNYGPAGEVVTVRWENGLFIPVGSATAQAAHNAVDAIFLKLLEQACAQGRDVSPNTGRNFAPAVFEGMPGVEGIKSKAFTAAMERLLAAGRVRVERVGPASRQKTRLVPA